MVYTNGLVFTFRQQTFLFYNLFYTVSDHNLKQDFKKAAMSTLNALGTEEGITFLCKRYRMFDEPVGASGGQWGLSTMLTSLLHYCTTCK